VAEQQPLDAAQVQHAIAEAKAAGATDAQIADYFGQRAPANVREMYYRTPGLGAPQQPVASFDWRTGNVGGTVGREAEIAGVHALSPWVGAAHALSGGRVGETSEEFNRLAPPPATRGERWLANTSETAGVAVPLAALGGAGLAYAGGAGAAEAAAAGLPYALGAVGGAAAPEARRQYMPGLNNTPGVGLLDFTLGTVAGGGLAQAGTALARRAVTAAPSLAIPTASRAAQAATTGPARAATGGPLLGAGRTMQQVGTPYPANWAPAATTAGGTVSAARGGMGALVGDGVEWIARDILGLPPMVSQMIGAGTGWVVGGGGHLVPRASPAGKIGMAVGGGTATGQELAQPSVSLSGAGGATASDDQNQLAPQ